MSHTVSCAWTMPPRSYHFTSLHFTSHRSLIKTEFRRWLVPFGSVYLLVKDIIIVVWRIYIKIEHQNLPEGKSLFFYLKSVCKAIRLRKVPGKVVGYWRLIFTTFSKVSVKISFQNLLEISNGFMYLDNLVPGNWSSKLASR